MKWVVLILLVLVLTEAHGLNCWLCGQEPGLGQDDQDRSRNRFKDEDDNGSKTVLKGSWCSHSIANASCSSLGKKSQCFKELWSVDGDTRIKRGCTAKDPRYQRPGCEEQITGAGGFKVVLCLCNDDLCNRSTSTASTSISFVLLIILSKLVFESYLGQFKAHVCVAD